jgi:gamma-glutamyltranspeptidase
VLHLLSVQEKDVQSRRDGSEQVQNNWDAPVFTPYRHVHRASASALSHITAEGAQRPPARGPNAAVSAGDPLTTAAAFETLASGGNAFDAGVAALLVSGVIEQDLYGLGGGEALILVYANSGSVTPWPAWTAATRRQCARPAGELPRSKPEETRSVGLQQREVQQ